MRALEVTRMRFHQRASLMIRARNTDFPDGRIGEAYDSPIKVIHLEQGDYFALDGKYFTAIKEPEQDLNDELHVFVEAALLTEEEAFLTLKGVRAVNRQDAFGAKSIPYGALKMGELCFIGNEWNKQVRIVEEAPSYSWSDVHGLYAWRAMVSDPIDLSTTPLITSFESYHESVAGTSLPVNAQGELVYATFGLCGETGEFADKLKKLFRNKGWNGDPKQLSLEDRIELLKEAGDVQWYLTDIITKLGSNLQEVMQRNAAKLYSRKARGVIKSEGDNR